MTVGLLATVMASLAAISGSTFAAFTDQASNSGNAFAAAPDWVPPVVTASAVGTVQGYTGPLRPGDSYYVYASASDAGGLPSGVASVTADMSSITASAPAAPLVAGSYTLGGGSYGWRTAALTVDAGVTTASHAYTHASVDGAGNSSGTQGGFSVDVDADSPVGVDVQATNASGGSVGAAETGDILTFTFSEPMAPGSIQSAWDGSATTVVVRIARSGSTGVTVRDASNTVALPLGTVATGNHVGNNTTVNFTNSTMVMSGASVSVTLGTPSGAVTTGSPTQMSWTPDAAATDLDGYACLTKEVLETGASDRDF